MPYPPYTSFADRVVAVLDKAALCVTAPVRRLGVGDFSPTPYMKKAPHMWVLLCVAGAETLLYACALLGPFKSMQYLANPLLLLPCGFVAHIKNHHALYTNGGADRTPADQQVVWQARMVMLATIAVLSTSALAAVTLFLGLARHPVDGLSLVAPLLMTLLYTECMALLAPVFVLSRHDHAPRSSQRSLPAEA
ncbi:hypothetical protein predicted by Glimmer/Critica [Acetobacter senegalensis]|uniref:Uncharacterized protein n=1 Tax=Acetobacter senegalensis TaxID=446692 RepID=A0A0U5EVZ3_9PROT|nr:hypothetical protein [Acetobacter senegalensis]CEF40241.1 hypothetical protein predicted by Glimmer/Critica [Acetobacter senegalensis]